MAVTNAAQAAVKSVADPNASYESLFGLWLKSRAACSGERFVKDFDVNLDVLSFTNLLIPFSPSMTEPQYEFYKAEAEWPGITAQFSRMLVGGLLRKQPHLKLPDGLPTEIGEWIANEFGKDDSSLMAFLDEALWEEMQTSRTWVFIDYPEVDTEAPEYDEELASQLKPYPVIQKAETVVNWRVSSNRVGKAVLDRVIVRGLEESYDENEFHPTYYDVAYVHELNEEGNYQIRVYKKPDAVSSVPVVAGRVKQKTDNKDVFTFDRVITVLANDEPLSYIPAWPLNGSIEPGEPILIPIIDKEVALYNKMSRRNHLLYGAATYTPVIMSDMTDDQFKEVVEVGLGGWLHLGQDDKIDVLKPPTESLADMDRAIATGIEEMAKLGIRMLTPETAQSGVALELRNAAQTAQLGTLNMKVSSVMRQIIVCMINWRYDLDITVSEVEFSLSHDFNPTPLGADWLRLATEWYEAGLIPRPVWITLLKMNDMLPPDYNDEEGIKEINGDEVIQTKREMETGTGDFATQIQKAVNKV
jgi:hypothetical protein